VTRRRQDDATVTISVGELRAIIRAEIDAALRTSRGSRQPKQKATANGEWSPETAIHEWGLVVPRGAR
jgi:hypothetical protein